MRWVIIKKGASRNPIIRARWVARHIAAKYGGNDGMYKLFAAMPPFEMIRFLLLRAVQCASGCDRKAIREAGAT